jgi:hypothetical protein
MTTRTATTEDGYKFTEQADGTWTDGDMTFSNLQELLDADLNVTITDSEA